MPLVSRLFSLVVAGTFLLPTAAAFAGDPAGIYALLPCYNTTKKLELQKRPVWSSSTVKGVTVRTVWSNVEPSQGALDWSFFDEAVLLASANGKTVGLSLSAGIYAPAWAYAAGAQAFNFTLTGPWQPTRACTMPEPWDPSFQQEWAGVISALGSRYDENPNVAYVMVSGVGYDIESFFVKTSADVAKLAALGGPARWLQGAEAIIDLYAAAFPHKPFILAMAPPIPGAPGASWLSKLVEYGMQHYPGRFGVMYDGLDAVANTDVYQDAAVAEYSSVAPTGFQMIWSSQGTEGEQRLQGSLAEALGCAGTLKAHWVEVYEVDCENAAFNDLLTETSQQLEKNATAP